MKHKCVQCKHADTIQLFHATILNFCMRKHSDPDKIVRNEYNGEYVKTIHHSDTDFTPNKKGNCKYFKPLTLWQRLWR